MRKCGFRPSKPLPIPWRCASRLIEGKSPKLSHLVRLFEDAGFAIWICLEVEQKVTAFCEYRLGPGLTAKSAAIDLWVQRATVEESLLCPVHAKSVDWPIAVNGVKVRVLSGTELAAASRWVLNWKFILAAVNGQERVADANRLIEQMPASVDRALPPAEIARRFMADDTLMVRTRVFVMLRTGKLRAPSLRDQSLSHQTVIEPA